MQLLNRELKIHKKYVILLLIVNFLILGLYYTYALFVTKQLQENVAVLVTTGNVITMTSTDLTDNSITVRASETKSITIDLENGMNGTVYYKLLHEKVPTGVMVYETDADGSSQGSLGDSATKSVLVTIKNDTSESVDVTFYCQGNTNSAFDKEIGYSYVNTNPNYDHSGANSPVLDDLNAIPVYYEATSTTAGVWKKADETNTNSSAIWYDYDNQQWANMVLVSNSKRATYLSAEAGTTVADADILAFFVWIPKYKYYIINANNVTNFERDLNVVFESESNGTVSCEDVPGNTTIYSEICRDNVYGKIYENLSTYSHPAFSDGAKGIWVAKFQVSNNGTKIVPNIASHTANVLTANQNARKFEFKGNIYGINGGTATTINADGSITGDENNLDTHLFRSREWGAVAILSSSLYGKSGNSLYFNDEIQTFKRIYSNNNQYGNTGCSSNYTASSTSFITTQSTTCIKYNDLTDYTHTTNEVTYPIGPIGPGASTTGTIYGIYDMAGHRHEVVAAMNYNSAMKLAITNYPDYYDLYSYNDYTGVLDNANNIQNLYRYKLGDGIREHYRTFTTNNMWSGGRLRHTRNEAGVMIRGGTWNDAPSIYTVDFVSHAGYGYRYAISMY